LTCGRHPLCTVVAYIVLSIFAMIFIVERSFCHCSNGHNMFFCVVDVHRDSILTDSVRALMSAKSDDLHKWMRIQFIGEPGIMIGLFNRPHSHISQTLAAWFLIIHIVQYCFYHLWWGRLVIPLEVSRPTLSLERPSCKTRSQVTKPLVILLHFAHFKFDVFDVFS